MTSDLDRHRLLRLTCGVAGVAFMSLLMGGVTGSFLRGAILGVAMSGATLLLLGMLTLRYAQTSVKGEPNEPVQFRIRTLMLIMALIGVFLATLRELVTHIPGSGELTWYKMANVGLPCVIAMFTMWLCIAESVMNFVAHQPWAHRLARGLFRKSRRGEPFDAT